MGASISKLLVRVRGSKARLRALTQFYTSRELRFRSSTSAYCPNDGCSWCSVAAWESASRDTGHGPPRSTAPR